MFKIVHKITAEILVGFEELESWLDDNFHLNYKLDDGSIHNKFDFKDRLELDKHGRRLVDNCPDSLGLSLYWIETAQRIIFMVIILENSVIIISGLSFLENFL